MIEHQLLGRLLPESVLGALFARLLCRAGVHTQFCRGSVTCRRPRAAVRSR